MNGFKSLKDVFCPVLKFREEKRTFAKVERGKVDFFLEATTSSIITDNLCF
jgi:hypothetical protein